MLLAIDTSAGTSVALVADGRVLAQVDEQGARRHAEAIDVLLRRALADAGVTPTEVAGVVAGMGPGPFTGLRVGIAAARAFAVGIGAPVHPVVSHDAVAWGREDRVLVVTDARRREVAWSTYGPGAVRLAGPELADPERLETVVDGYEGFVRIDAAAIPAGPLGLVAERALAEGRPAVPDRPLYLRAPDVTVVPR